MLTSAVSIDELTKKKLPFAAGKDSAEFQRELIIFLIKEFDGRRTKHVPAENLLVFQHGREWNYQRQEKTGSNPHTGEMKLKSSTVVIGLDRVLANDLTLISDFIEQMAGAMEERLVVDVFNEMSMTAQEAGNTFSIPKTGITGEVFLEMIRSTEVRVGNDGKVSRPSLYLPPGIIDQMKQELDSLGPEFKAKADALWLEKEEQALKQEAERLARYDKTE
jgi:hypothetical protein